MRNSYLLGFSYRVIGRGLPVAIMILALISCGETVDKRRTVGYKGEARGNPFLAAQRLLEQQGHATDSQSGLGALDGTTSTLFLTPSSLNTVERAKRVERWVEDGGHLVVMVYAGERRGNDFRMNTLSRCKSSVDKAADQFMTPGLEFLLAEFEVELVQWDHEMELEQDAMPDRDEWEAMDESDRVLLGSEVVHYGLGGDKMEIHHWAGIGFEYEAQSGDGFGTGKMNELAKHRYLSLTRRDGRVSLLADARPLRNRYIAYGDHARLVEELVGLSRGGLIVFADGAGDHFFAMVWRHFWMAVVGLTAVVVFWLWKNLPRFGPIQDLPGSDAREFSGQVQGIGRFLWRHKRDDVMLASLRGAIERKLALHTGVGREEVFEQLAQRADLPLASVKEAMTREHVREPGVMVRVVKNLQHLLQTIK